MTVDFKEQLAGRVIDDAEPEWDALDKLVGPEETGWFMWMYAIELEDGTILNVYKHIESREYLHLGADGSAFTYLRWGTYTRTSARNEANFACERSSYFNELPLRGPWASGPRRMGYELDIPF